MMLNDKIVTEYDKEMTKNDNFCEEVKKNETVVIVSDLHDLIDDLIEENRKLTEERDAADRACAEVEKQYEHVFSQMIFWKAEAGKLQNEAIAAGLWEDSNV